MKSFKEKESNTLTFILFRVSSSAVVEERQLHNIKSTLLFKKNILIYLLLLTQVAATLNHFIHVNSYITH